MIEKIKDVRFWINSQKTGVFNNKNWFEIGSFCRKKRFFLNKEINLKQLLFLFKRRIQFFTIKDGLKSSFFFGKSIFLEDRNIRRNTDNFRPSYTAMLNVLVWCTHNGRAHARNSFVTSGGGLIRLDMEIKVATSLWTTSRWWETFNPRPTETTAKSYRVLAQSA